MKTAVPMQNRFLALSITLSLGLFAAPAFAAAGLHRANRRNVPEQWIRLRPGRIRQ